MTSVGQGVLEGSGPSLPMRRHVRVCGASDLGAWAPCAGIRWGSWALHGWTGRVDAERVPGPRVQGPRGPIRVGEAHRQRTGSSR